ncbi:MAG: hypothetical protein JW740_02915 [Candidatus Zambryskibacteria bacterium]|nr:hypothetical protein [Candidatus Zambryskibacteria bacterium]
MDSETVTVKDLEKINEVHKIARFYGFRLVNSPKIEKQDFDSIKNLGEYRNLVEKVALLRIYFDNKFISSPQPVCIYCDRPFPGLKEKKKSNYLEGSLACLGSTKSICECLCIESALSILNKIGYKNLEIHVNSVGDKESMVEFQKRIVAFIRKNINDFPTNLRQTLKKDIFAILRENENECYKECPKSIDFLSEQSRNHFKEVLEFLETTEIPYQVDHKLFSNSDIGTETVFSINSDGEELAFGFRFSKLAKKIGYKKDAPGCILDISAHLKKKLKKVKAREFKPQFYLVQFGPEAKLKSFSVLRELEKTGTNVLHSITKDKLGTQMGAAHNSEALYLLIIGQKEALENTVMVRNTITHAQTIIPLSQFANCIKEIIKDGI